MTAKNLLSQLPPNIFCDLSGLRLMGEGALIGRTVRIRKPQAVEVGKFSIIDDFTYISCELILGDYCHVAPNVTMSGGAGKITIGNFVGIGAGATFHPATSDYLSASFELPSIPKEYHFGGTVGDIRIGDHVVIGAHSTVMPGVDLPEGFGCAAHTVVRSRQYEPWTLYGGYDCKKIYKRAKSEIVKSLAAKLLAERG